MILEIDEIIGLGNECVYSYYFPSQVTDGRFPHKIGKTKDNPTLRILSQQAGMQEKPVIGTIIWCDNCHALEQYFHLCFKEHKLDTFGDEWYNIHPSALKNVFEDGLPSLPWYEQLHYHRLRNAMTQMQLAEYADLRQATISKVESGENVNMSTILEICRELKVRMTFVPIE
jgi:DNA-binding Xre family transcriptional regulator